MEKRAFERIPVNIDVRFYCGKRVYPGTVMNISENGMFISTNEMCFPFDSQLEIYVPFEKDILHVPVNLIRLEMSPDSNDGIGVEIKNPSERYLKLVANLRSDL